MKSWACRRTSRLCLLLPLALALLALLVARPAWGTATSDSTAEDTSEESGGLDESRFGLDTLRPAQGIRQKVKLFIGIPSLHTNLEQRQAARDTWIEIAKATQVGCFEGFSCLCCSDQHTLMVKIFNSIPSPHTKLEQRQAERTPGSVLQRLRR